MPGQVARRVNLRSIASWIEGGRNVCARGALIGFTLDHQPIGFVRSDAPKRPTGDLRT